MSQQEYTPEEQALIAASERSHKEREVAMAVRRFDAFGGINPWEWHERQLVGCAMLDPTQYAVVAGIVQTRDFGDPVNAAIWTAIAHCHADGEPCDVSAVLDRCFPAVSLDVLMDRTEHAGCTLRAEYEARQVAAEGKARRLRLAVGDLAARAPKTEPAEIAEGLRRIQSGYIDDAQEQVASATDLANDTWNSLQTEGGTLLSTGIETLDAAIGGLRPGALVVVGAPTSAGKTALALNLTRTALNAGKRVLTISLEMKRRELGQRMVADLAGVDYGDIVNGKTGDRQQDCGNALSTLSEKDWHIVDGGGVTIHGIAAMAERLALTGKIDLIVVDYLQQVSVAPGRSKTDNRAFDVAQISRGLKQLAMKLECSVLALSQLNRASGQNARPLLSDLRESGAIEQDADVVLLLWRPDDATGMGHQAELQVAKQRQGKKPLVRLNWSGMFQRFTVGTWEPSAPVAPQKPVKADKAWKGAKPRQKTFHDKDD